MVRREDIKAAIQHRLNHILLVAEAALPQSQFRPFRKIVLDNFGSRGLEADLEKIFSGQPRSGEERAGPEHTRQRKGAAMNASCYRRR